MYRHIKAAQLLGAATLVMMTIACSNVKQDSDELKDDAKQAGEKAADSAADTAHDAAAGVSGAIDNAGRAGDAAMETFDVKAALIADDRIDSSNINVDTDHTTKTVILKGRVPTAEQKAMAGDIATTKAVGYRVDNRLTVGTR